MHVKGAEGWQIKEAADAVGVRLYNFRKSGKGFAFQLKTGEPRELREDWRGKQRWMPRYQRLSQRERRSTAKGYEGTWFAPVVPGAVCWHGHRDFLRALFERAPEAVVRTAFITYRGKEDFERNYRETRYGKPGVGNTYMGAQPTAYAEACTCRGEE